MLEVLFPLLIRGDWWLLFDVRVQFSHILLEGVEGLGLERGRRDE